MTTGKRELLESMNKESAQPGSVTYAKRQMELMVACVEDVENAVLKLDKSIYRSSELSDRLGRKLFWLNVVLTVATVMVAVATVCGVVVTVLQFIK